MLNISTHSYRALLGRKQNFCSNVCSIPHLFSVSLLPFTVFISSCFPPSFQFFPPVLFSNGEEQPKGYSRSSLSVVLRHLKKEQGGETVACGQDALPTHIVGLKVHDHDGDGSKVLALTVVPADDPDAVPYVPCLVPLPPSPPSDVGLSAPHPAPAMVVTSSSGHLDAVLVEDCNAVLMMRSWMRIS